MANLTAQLSRRGLDVISLAIEAFAHVRLVNLEAAKTEIATMQALLDEAKDVIASIETNDLTRSEALELCGDLGEDPPPTIRSIAIHGELVPAISL